MNIWRKKIPTILALFLLIVGTAGAFFLLEKGGVGFLKASPETTPQEVKITNITDNSFTVSWLTEEINIGFVQYGPTGSLGKTVSQSVPSLIHYLKIENLQPTTQYYFKVNKDSKTYKVITAPQISATPIADTAYGTVLKDSGFPATNVIIFLSLVNATPLSALTGNDGQWAIPLSMARSVDLSQYINYDSESSIENIFIQGGQWGTANAVTTTQNDSPVPDITLKSTHDFRQQTDSEFQPALSAITSRFSLQPLTTPPPTGTQINILNLEENENINAQRPEFHGTGPKETSIEIILESEETFSATVFIDEDGNWHWTPPSSLLPGQHTVTIILEDGTTFSRGFTILAAGDSGSPAFTATPSATLAPSPTITPTPIVRTSLPSTDSGIPESGYLTPTLSFVILGITLVLSGLFLNFKFSF